MQDKYFQGDQVSAGPFTIVKDFNDWVDLAIIPHSAPMSKRHAPPPYCPHLRYLLPDKGEIHFTHADLTLYNIMVSGLPGQRRVSGIVDWEQAGWYPEYWEYCKMHIAVHEDHDWCKSGWIKKITECYDDAMEAVADYWLVRCP